MSLPTGHKLAHYEIVKPIGKGGMGEVYRAKDSKLGRDVAIKILPDEFAQDEERLRRFQREAKVLASLNHPNIASIYGLEQSGDTHYLVLELVPGETLAERIAHGPIPVEEALDIAGKIAEALEEAHEQGIVHRDLKPANVKQTEDGKIKVLDFGLAKAFGEEGAEGDAATSMSPTITRDATRVGVILGTAAYMSPEQAKGKRVDKRTDVFAFGALVYEMLTGKKAFPGDDVSEVLASVIKLEPDWDQLPSNVPNRVRQVVQRSLAKDPKRRIRDIGDARLALEEDERRDDAIAPAAKGHRGQLVLASVTSLVLGLIVGDALWRAPISTPSLTRLTVSLPVGDTLLAVEAGSTVALSPDGRTIVYVATRDGVDQLFRRTLDELEPEALPGTEGARDVFFSPDGAWVAFGAADRLMKVRTSGGGAPVEIARAPAIFGGSWSEDGTIWLGTDNGALRRVPGSGGEPETITNLGEGDFEQGLPQLLPDGETVLFYIDRGTSDVIALHNLSTGETRDLVPGSSARYIPSGHLLITRSGSLLASPFDVENLRVLAEPTPILEGLQYFAQGGAWDYDVGADGTFVYIAEGPEGPLSHPVWVDGDGFRPIDVEPDDVIDIRLSPDGARLALVDGRDPFSIVIHDIERGSFSTLSEARERAPAWSPDGRELAFARWEVNRWNLYVKLVDATDEGERLLNRFSMQSPQFWLPDGTGIVVAERVYGRGFEDTLLLLPREGEREEQILLRPSDVARGATLSPDGRYMAYDSGPTGDVYVRPFPDVDTARWIISSGGGASPQWVDGGSRLLYRSPTAIMEVDVDTSAAFSAGRPRLVMNAPLPAERAIPRRAQHTLAATHDRARIAALVDEPVADADKRTQRIVVVTGWLDELTRLVPTED